MEYYIINLVWHFLMRARSRITFNMNGWDKETYPVDSADLIYIDEAINMIARYLDKRTAAFYID